MKKPKQIIKQSNTCIKKYLIFCLPCYINKSAVRVPSVGTNLEIYKHKHLLENQEWREYINVVILKWKKNRCEMKNNSCFSFICKAYKT